MIRSRGEADFWKRYHALPGAAKQLARKNFQLWKEDPKHPSLRFKRITKPNWAVRVGDHYRAVGLFEGDHFLWVWIGTHEEYNKRY